ncbi:MAG: phospholipase D-like domain-containing protein [Deltaproteobacteria bacterium]|jgi:phosphatidylserine/phosphatidylglycerophosphate/cardiolipin synthase-like enzyme
MMHSRGALLLCLLGSTIFGCECAGSPMEQPGAGVDAALPPGVDGGVTSPDGFVPPDAPLPPSTLALIELHALDLWAQALPAGSRVSVTRDGAVVPTTGTWPVAVVPLVEAATYEVRISAAGHEDFDVAITYDGSADLDAITVRRGAGSERAGLVASHDVRTSMGRTLPVHAIFAGLRHRWFSAQGRPARRGNRVRLMTSGEEAWAQVAEDLLAARDTVHAATWWWDSTFELVRDPETHVTSTLADRRANTILGILDDIFPDKRVLVGQFVEQDGSLSWLSADSDLRARGATASDGFEFMGQANETSGMFTFQVAPFLFGDRVRARWPEAEGRTFDADAPIASTVPSRPVDLTEWPISLDVDHASYHQKFFVIDGTVAFIGGMNLRPVDWDTDAHLVFEPRRMALGASSRDRMDVAAGEELPDNGPRKDYMTRIEGPIAQDAEEVFHARWAHLLDERVEYSANASDYEVVREQPSFADGVQAQVTATLPAPFDEHAIAETWLNAIENAEQYILIEDQYFRIPMFLDALVARMTSHPSLELVVITKPINELTDPGCEWTYRTSQELATRFPTRFHPFRLRSFDTQEVFGFQETEARFVDVDVHSKLLIVDDVFLSVGSCNKNNRGVTYEGELNVAVYDAAWVREARRRVLALVLPEGVTPSDEARRWVEQLATAAAWNERVREEWDATGGDLDLDGDPLPMSYQPEGLLYPLVFDVPDECLLEGVGPDMT